MLEPQKALEWQASREDAGSEWRAMQERLNRWFRAGELALLIVGGIAAAVVGAMIQRG